MDRAVFLHSPQASTSGAQESPSSPPVPPSDAGELEEMRAALLGDRYWARSSAVQYRRGLSRTASDVCQHPGESDDELAMSPFQPRICSGATTARPSVPSPSFAAPLRTLPSSPLAASTQSSLPPPAKLGQTRQRPRSPSPVSSVPSSQVIEFLAPQPAARRSSPRPSTSPSPSPSPSPSRRTAHSSPTRQSPSPPPVIPPDPDPPPAGPGGRALRTRTAAQLKPYSVEQQRYTVRLLRNGWEGAVVRGVKGGELSAEERRRRKEEAERRPRDSLGGWLVDGEAEADSEGLSRRAKDAGMAPVGRYERDEEYGGGEDDDEEEDGDVEMDGMDLLEREARRKERMERALDAAINGNKRKRKQSAHRHGPSRIDNPHYHASSRPVQAKRPRTHGAGATTTTTSRSRGSALFSGDASSSEGDLPVPTALGRRRLPKAVRARRLHAPSRAESAPPSSSPAHSPRKRAQAASRASRDGGDSCGGGAGGARGVSRVRSLARGGSEPPAPSPRRRKDRRDASVARRPRGMAAPAGSVHARGNAGGADDGWEEALRAVSSAEELGGRGWRSDGESEAPSTSGSDADEREEEQDDDDDDDRPAPRLEVRGKRRRALGAMMPAVFLKKAVADLKLMARERAEGDVASSSDELNSGDEEALARERRNRARMRTRPALRDAPMRLDGEAFTDESGSEPDRSDAAPEEEEENDAVASWLHSFAPQRGADEDIVDRFLKRAKRPPQRAKKAKPRGGASGGGKDSMAGRAAGGMQKQRKDGRTVLQDSGNYVAGYRRLNGPVAPARQRPRQISLDTDAAIFAFAGLHDDRRHESDDEVVVVSAPRAAPLPRAADLGIPAPAPAVAPAKDGEVWASFGRFSHDFDLQYLPAGLRFSSPDSFVKNGYLFSLVDASALPQTPFSVDVFGCALLSGMPPAELDPLVPTICDGVHDALVASLDADSAEPSNPFTEVGVAMRFLGHWTATRRAAADGDTLPRVGIAILVHLERLEVRLDALVVPKSASKRFRLHRIVLSWYVLDIAARLQKTAGTGTVEAPQLLRLARALVRRLIQHGPDRTMRSLKAAKDPGALIADITVETWLGLVSLACKSGDFGDGAFKEQDLWQVVLDETRATLAGTKAAYGLAGGEVASYTAMMLCAISQFSPSGISTSRPRLAAHWPVLLKTLEAIQPAALALPDHTLSSTAVARRDRYLWTLFARCLVFVERWRWTVDIRDDLLPRLFDLLNARRLADLTTETAGDFPLFLQDLGEFGKIALDPVRDTAFSIFLKLVIAAANALAASTDAEKRRRGAQLTRLFLRLSPMVSSAWSKNSVELTRAPSILVNHYALHLAFAAILPSAASQRVEQAARLIAFADVDDDARKTAIRAALYFALVLRSHDLPLASVVEWFAAMAGTLKREFAAVERERRKEEQMRRDGARARAAAAVARGDPLWTRALMITMVLRSVQVITRWKRVGEERQAFPDLALLHPVWTSQLLDSPLALDPMIGREAIRTVECFLDVRDAALPRAAGPAQAIGDNAGVSQDDFGMLDDLDFNDPALNAMLGIETGGGNACDEQQHEDVLKTKDKAFAELLKSTIAPAFFRLVSNIFVDQPGTGPTVGDRISYAQSAVECWARCLAVAVENRVADWRPYLQYGDQSWKRLSDPVGRRDIGLFLAIQILKHDPAVYSVFADDILEIWFESIVAKRLTSQHVLLEQLLNVDLEHMSTVSPVLEGLPFERSAATGRMEVEQLDLLDKRIEVLSTLFRNAARLVAATSAAGAHLSTTQLLHRPSGPSRTSLPRGAVMNLLRSMLAAMRDNLTAIREEAPRAQYSAFVKLVLAALSGAGATPSAGPGQPLKKGPFDEMALPDIKGPGGEEMACLQLSSDEWKALSLAAGLARSSGSGGPQDVRAQASTSTADKIGSEVGLNVQKEDEEWKEIQPAEKKPRNL
ncbi:hypothetical protein JCM3770_005104 [Rhodotorula araucariae]